MKGPSQIVALDFTEHDTIEALDRLRRMAKDGEISGMVFSVLLAHKRLPRKVMLGATGRPANDLIVAAGMSALMHHNITRAAMSEASS